MTCLACGYENRPDKHFCVACGGQLEATCPSCGTRCQPGEKFCGECGAQITGLGVKGLAARGRTEPLTSNPVTPNPLSYTPKYLADKILTSRAALEGERKQVTVLFADVKGSMELAEQVDPELFHRIMERFAALLAEGVHRFEGTVTQFTGDGIMALFGAPIAHEDHAQRACYTALHLRDELRRYANELRVSHGLSFFVRMGMNSGEVVVGAIGDDLHMDYTALGQTVGLAQRMEQLAEPGRVCLTGETARLVSGYFQLAALGPLQVKGVSALVEVFELEGVGTVRTRLDVSRARGFSRFVGRTDEMAAIEAALGHAIAGQGQVVGVVGEAGVGKSRLCYEFVQRCRAQGVAVQEAHGAAHGKTIALLPVLAFVRDYFGILPADSDRQAREKIAGRMVLLDEGLRAALPLLFDFLAVPDPERPVRLADPEARQRQFFTVMKRLVHARSQREPAAILFEDLHWFDGASEAFVENLVEAVPGTRTLLLVNFRPEYHAGWMQKSYYQQLPLLPLDAAAIEELLHALLGGDPTVQGLGALIRERTGGNPFFIEEVVQSLVESGRLAGARGAYRLIGRVDELGIPSSVQTVLAARIDRLPEREKQVLQTAAVIGRRFSEPILRALTDLPDADLSASLRALQGAEFFYEEALYPEVELAFKHPLTQEVAYRSQLSEHRARTHRAVARAIEERHRDKLDEHAALLAYHWEAAGEAEEAARWHVRAAEWTGWRDLGETVRHWGQVRALLEGAPESAETIGLRLTACTRLLAFGARLGISKEEGTHLFEEGTRLADRSGNLPLHVLLLAAYGSACLVGGEFEEGLRNSLEVRRLAKRTGDKALRMLAQADAFIVTAMLGRLQDALALAEETLALAAGDPDLGRSLLGGRSWYVLYLSLKGWILAEMGRLAEATSDAERALALAQDRGEEETVGNAYAGLAFVAWQQGDVTQAMRHARRGFESAERSGSIPVRVGARWALGMADVLAQSWNEAVETLEGAVAMMREGRSGFHFEPRLLAQLAEAHLGRGDWSQARARAEEAVAAACRLKMRSIEAAARLTQARVLLATEDAPGRAAALAALDQAAALVEETSAAGLLPFIHVERAKLAGNDDARQRELRAAQRLFTAMGAPLRAEQIGRELSGQPSARGAMSE